MSTANNALTCPTCTGSGTLGLLGRCTDCRGTGAQICDCCAVPGDGRGEAVPAVVLVGDLPMCAEHLAREIDDARTAVVSARDEVDGLLATCPAEDRAVALARHQTRMAEYQAIRALLRPEAA